MITKLILAPGFDVTRTADVFRAWMAIVTMAGWDDRNGRYNEETVYVESVTYDEDALTDIVVLRFQKNLKTRVIVYRDNLHFLDELDRSDRDLDLGDNGFYRATPENHGCVYWEDYCYRSNREKFGLYPQNKKQSHEHNNAYSELMEVCNTWLALESRLRGTSKVSWFETREDEGDRKRKYFETVDEEIEGRKVTKSASGVLTWPRNSAHGPEILRICAQYLTRSSRLAGMRVSKMWNEILAPAEWKEIEIVYESEYEHFVRIHGKTAPWEILHKYRDQVRRVSMRPNVGPRIPRSQ